MACPQNCCFTTTPLLQKYYYNDKNITSAIPSVTGINLLFSFSREYLYSLIFCKSQIMNCFFFTLIFRSCSIIWVHYIRSSTAPVSVDFLLAASTTPPLFTVGWSAVNPKSHACANINTNQSIIPKNKVVFIIMIWVASYSRIK